MMSPSIDIRDLQQAMERALKDKSFGLAGGWSASQAPQGRGRVYRGATFHFGEKDWAVVRGPQRPSSAQLLDATACLKQAVGAAHAVAWLDPETKHPRHLLASSEFRNRYQAAVWHGLGIVALETDAWTWEPTAALTTCGDFMDALAKRVGVEIEAGRRANNEWAKVVQLGNSNAAEELVRAAVGAALEQDFCECPKRERAFDALWRHAKTDGLWRRDAGFPGSVALEVKVTEDVGAPFCQAFDDLGAFDSVLYVRLLNERTREEVRRRSSLEAVKVDVQDKAPVRFIDVHF